MAKFKPGESGNPKGRPLGTGRVEQYRALLDPHVPELLALLVDKAKGGDMTAVRMVLERVYPVRDAAIADLMDEIESLRQMVEARA